MNFIKTDNHSLVSKLRTELYQTFTTALDSMWESLYIASSDEFLIEKDHQTIGYCCIDSEKNLTQIYLKKEQLQLMQTTIKSLIDKQLITSAKLSSIEPIAFNACLYHSKSLKNNSYCFQFANHKSTKHSTVQLIVATEKDTEQIKAFYKTQVGFDDNFGYTENLIRRKELYIARENDTFLGTGECRLSDSQPQFADVGVAVNKDHRGRGIATQILEQLAKKAIEANRAPICSTTIDNIASKKAIQKAGFYCSHIIFDLLFFEE